MSVTLAAALHRERKGSRCDTGPDRGYDEGDQDVHSDWEGLVSGQSTASEGEIIRNGIRPALDAARAVGFPIVYVSNSAPRIAIQQSAYGEQKWETLHVVKDEIRSEERR